MSKIIKAVLVGAYIAVIIQFVKVLTSDRTEKLVEINYVFRSPGTLKRLEREIKRHGRNLTAILSSYKKPRKLPTDLKFVLKYTSAYAHYTSSAFQNGQRAFIESNCSYANCYLTNDKSLLIDMRHFDAILFDVENTWDELPLIRSWHQRYIFTASESGDYYPICHPYFDTYFNWTWTYRLDSEIRWTYITIVDLQNKVVGPKINMTWINPMIPFPERLKVHLSKKKKLAAWFVSNCYAKTPRLLLKEAIQKHLTRYGHEVDVFGSCGSRVCPRERMEDCLEVLEEDYYFYFAFENSMSEDYVTEKVLHALKHYTVPVVFGGADYSRFLPPGSYIDATVLDPAGVASLMMEAVENKNQYYDYFRWHNHYAYKDIGEVSDICTLCQLLNERKQPSVVRDFRRWWNPDFHSKCQGDYGQNFTE